MTISTVPKTTAGIITGVDLVAYFTGDPQRSIAFYRDVLGLTPTEIDEQGRGAEFTLGDGSTFGVWRPDEASTSGAAVMFAVSDIHTALPQLRANGAQLSEPEETPVCFMAFGADPDGHPIIIHQRKTTE